MELSSQVLSRPGMILSGKPTFSPKGQRLQLSDCASTEIAVSVIANGNIDSVVDLMEQKYCIQEKGFVKVRIIWMT